MIFNLVLQVFLNLLHISLILKVVLLFSTLCKLNAKLLVAPKLFVLTLLQDWTSTIWRTLLNRCINWLQQEELYLIQQHQQEEQTTNQEQILVHQGVFICFLLIYF